MKVKNFNELATNDLRRDALQIIEAGLQAIDTSTVIHNEVKLEENKLCVGEKICSVDGTKSIYLVAVGKCAYEASHALSTKFGERIVGGVVLDVSLPEKCDLGRNIKCFGGTHPVPTEININATKEIVKLLVGLNDEDLVLFAISGGASTLLCLPDEGYSCLDEELILKALFKAGADILEINTIRKHMSLARGGYLAKHAYPAQVISLIFSDVVGNNIEFVASGPTVLDTTTVEDADKILAKYGILQACDLAHCGLIETPKDVKYFKNVNNILFVTNEMALEVMEAKSVALGYKVIKKRSDMISEAREIGQKVVEELKHTDLKSVVLLGGETTVTIHGQGKGGRNSELCLSGLQMIEDGMVLTSVNSDGHDNGEDAGALVDYAIKQKAQELGLEISDYLENNDSRSFFEKVGGLVVTGDTGSNVSDLVVGLRVGR